jgi:hypothetical protein
MIFIENLKIFHPAIAGQRIRKGAKNKQSRFDKLCPANGGVKL